MGIHGGSAVGDAESILHLVPPSVRPHDELPVLVGTIAADPRARCAFVVDDDSVLIGVVPEAELDRDLLLLMAPRAASLDGVSTRALSRAARGVHEVAAHLMRDPVTVVPSDSLTEAVRRMYAGAQECAAVVDDRGHLLGYLSLFEVLAELFSTATKP